MIFREKKQLVICATAAAVIAGFALLVYLPLRSRLNSLAKAKAEQSLIVATASAQSAELPLLENKLVSLQAMVRNYEQNVPADRQLGTFLQQIAALMNEHNLRDQIVQPDREIQLEDLGCIPVSIQCRGSLRQIFGFFRSLQHLNRLIRIEQIRLANDGKLSGDVSMQTSVIIYYRQRQVSAGPALQNRG